MCFVPLWERKKEFPTKTPRPLRKLDNMKNNNDIHEKVLSVQDFLISENRVELIEGIYHDLTKSQKQISSRFFYNDAGSELFEEITSLPEYYPTRTEKAILLENAANILGDFASIDIVELGSGDCSKISILLDAIPQNQISNVRYIPIDVSEAAILKSADILSLKYPGLKIHGLLADFMKHLDSLPGNSPRLICFFGSTLGNLTRKQANEFLLGLKNIMNLGDKLLLGLDMVKDPEILHKAYNDKQGITAQFNKNSLNVINDLAETNFNSSDFNHLAFYNENEARIEMHLEALKDVSVTSKYFPEPISIAKGETIHTENSHKFLPEHISQLEIFSGLNLKKSFTDVNRYFSLNLFQYPIVNSQ